MQKVYERQTRRREAKEKIAQISDKRDYTLVIHYSCEGFSKLSDRAVPRIVSIVARNLSTGQTASFSIHQFAERKLGPRFSTEDINANYDKLEKDMLTEFYDYAKYHRNYNWVHWNMRNMHYGFAALEYRYSILNGDPFVISELRQPNLRELLVGIYGPGYIESPRLENLMKENTMNDDNFLSGEKEAEAFEQGRYTKMHLSTHRKVAVIAEIITRAADGTLKTKAKLRDIYGSRLAFATEKLREAWYFPWISIIGAMAGIISLLKGCS